MDVFIGQIMWAGFDIAPQGWLPCDGRVVQVSQYQALFSLIGSKYGGNGSTNFALPNFQSRQALGYSPALGHSGGGTPAKLGERGGGERVTLSQAQMPAHAHAAFVTPLASSSDQAEASPADRVFAVRSPQGVPTNGYRSSGDTVLAGAAATIEPTGESQLLEIRQPYLALNVLIAIDGIYPARSEQD